MTPYTQYPISKVVREYIFIILGLFPFALMVNWIFVPHNVVGAGLTGICSIIYYATQGLFPNLFPEYGGAIPMWLSTLSINAILLLIAMLSVGWRFCVRTLVGALALAFWYRVIPMRVEPLIADPVTACIVGGVVFGLSLGLQREWYREWSPYLYRKAKGGADGAFHLHRHSTRT